MNPLLSDLQAKLTPEDFAKVREYLYRHQPNSNKVKASFELSDGTKISFGIGRQSKLVRVYGLRSEGKRDLPVALSVASWHQLKEALPALIDFINKNADVFEAPTVEAPATVESNGEVAEQPRRKRNRQS